HIGDTVAVGDTVRGEWPDNALDVDRFLVYVGARAHLNVLLARGSQGSPLVGSLRQPGAWYPLQSVGSGSDTLGVDQSGRIDLPASGWYTFDVQVAGDWLGTDSLSPYTFLIEPANTTPEHVPATITFGDTVTTETIDFPGDYDEFQLTATPGQVVDATLAVAKIQYGTFALQAYDSTTATIIGSVTVGASTAGSIQFTVPTSGRVTLSVAQPFAPGIHYDAVGTYRLWVQPAASQ
ncbi:MAG TPA: hypothetical protein VJ992_07040, partial [Gemmatimonadales bacterium]|nr:hypothetical protein [Gemmatimonadales bacterium]